MEKKSYVDSYDEMLKSMDAERERIKKELELELEELENAIADLINRSVQAQQEYDSIRDDC